MDVDVSKTFYLGVEWMQIPNISKNNYEVDGKTMFFT